MKKPIFKELPDHMYYSTSIRDTPLTVRTANCLIADGLYVAGDVFIHSEVELLKTPNLGKKQLAEIKEVFGFRINNLPRHHGCPLDAVPPHMYYNMRLSDTNLNVRARNALEADGITRVHHTFKRTDRELLKVINFGKAYLAELYSVLGLRFENRLQ